jgi:hypothetical protein
VSCGLAPEGGLLGREHAWSTRRHNLDPSFARGVTLFANRSASAAAIDGTNLYIISAGSLMRAPLDGGTPTVLATGQSVPMAIAVDGTSVYWVNNGDGRVMKVSPK